MPSPKLQNAPGAIPAPELPATVAALKTNHRLVRLCDDFEPLAMAGTQFEDALITTRNEAVLLSGRGGYGALQTENTPFRLSRKRVNLRVASRETPTIFRCDPVDDADGPASLVAVDAQGVIFHRVQYRPGLDELVAASVPELENSEISPVASFASPAQPAQNVVPFSAIRTARETWDSADMGLHLNDLLQGGGETRRRSLPHIGRGRCWRVRADVLPSFLCFLADRGNSFARMAIGQGMLQAHVGPLSSARFLGSALLLDAENSVFSVAQDRIAEVWVCAARRSWHLELYDATGCAVGVLAGDPMADLSQWRDYLASLPAAM